MERNGAKKIVQEKADNLNIVIGVQEKWNQIRKNDVDVMRTHDRQFVVDIRNQLQDFLTQLESVKVW